MVFGQGAELPKKWGKNGIEFLQKWSLLFQSFFAFVVKRCKTPAFLLESAEGRQSPLLVLLPMGLEFTGQKNTSIPILGHKQHSRYRQLMLCKKMD